jgi:hypothetical protein
MCEIEGGVFWTGVGVLGFEWFSFAELVVASSVQNGCRWLQITADLKNQSYSKLIVKYN